MVDFPKRTEISSWTPWLLLLLLSALLQSFHVYPVLRLELHGPASHWAYQIFTCHLVHINNTHWLSDALALIVIAILFHRLMDFPCWLLSIVTSAIIISAGLLIFPHGLHSYAGLSGILHGLFVTGALLLYRHRSQLATLLLTLLAAKLLIEPALINLGYIQFGFPVTTSAHVYGSLGGILAWSGCWIRHHRASG